MSYPLTADEFQGNSTWPTQQCGAGAKELRIEGEIVTKEITEQGPNGDVPIGVLLAALGAEGSAVKGGATVEALS